MMKMIVGLGNPGRKYRDTRHNVGFMFVDEIASVCKTSFAMDKKFKAEIASVVIQGAKVLLVKPQTYMNLSGNAVRPIASYYEVVSEDILVVYDDLDLPVGKLRLRTNGSSGGHKGMDHLLSCLQPEQMKRVRIGIDKSMQMETADYVLSKFKKDEKIAIALTLAKAYEIAESFVSESFDQTMNRFN